MKLLITRAGNFIELEDSVKMKQNDIGIWYWEDFFKIDGKKIIAPNFDNYKEIYEDLKGRVK